MKLNNIDHIAIAVKDLDKSIKLYEELFGLKCYLIEEVEDQKVKTAFFKLGDVKLELLEANDPQSPIAKFIEKRGEGMHHIAYLVDDVKASLEELEGNGVQLIDKHPRTGAENFDIAFLHPKSTSGVLTELVGKKK